MKLIQGWGIKDVDYPVSRCEKVGDKKKTVWRCPYYDDWKYMIRRCFDTKFQQNQPTYIGCTICEDWRYLSNFIKWVDSQPNKDWQNCSLDKDFLVEGNKHYSPETCIYIPQGLNTFIVNTSASSNCLRGACFYEDRGGVYRSYCSNPFSKKSELLGVFPTELEAHKAWKAKKHEHALKLADMQEDLRVAKRLREMYAPE